MFFFLIDFLFLFICDVGYMRSSSTIIPVELRSKTTEDKLDIKIKIK